MPMPVSPSTPGLTLNELVQLSADEANAFDTASNFTVDDDASIDVIGDIGDSHTTLINAPSPYMQIPPQQLSTIDVVDDNAINIIDRRRDVARSDIANQTSDSDEESVVLLLYMK